MANGIWSWHGWLSTQKSLWLSTWAKLSCREPRCRRCRRPTQRWEKMGRTVSKDWLAILGHNTLKFARLLFAVFSPFQLCHDQPEPACNASHQAASWGPIRLIQQQSIRKHNQFLNWFLSINQNWCVSHVFIIYNIYFQCVAKLGISTFFMCEGWTESWTEEPTRLKIFTYSIIHSMLTSELKPNLPTTTLNCYCL